MGNGRQQPVWAGPKQLCSRNEGANQGWLPGFSTCLSPRRSDISGTRTQAATPWQRRPAEWQGSMIRHPAQFSKTSCQVSQTLTCLCVDGTSNRETYFTLPLKPHKQMAFPFGSLGEHLSCFPSNHPPSTNPESRLQTLRGSLPTLGHRHMAFYIH